MTYDRVIRGERVLSAAGFRPREVAVTAGKIVATAPLGTGLEADDIIELAADEVLIPGLVDTHVHVNEPGRTDWEGFDSATRAAARGGITTIIDMPLNSIPPTTSVAGLEAKVAATEGKRHVHVGFWGGAVPGNTADLRPLHEAGVVGVKCFMQPSGVDEFPPLSLDELEADLRELATFDGQMIVHAEDERTLDAAPAASGDAYDGYLASRPRSAENLAIAEVIARAKWAGAKAHIVHVSSSDALPMIASAKRDGVRITAETCPHYLTLSSAQVPDGNTAFKCAPPIRESANQDALWQGLLDGTIDIIVTDHSPSTLELKNLDTGDFGTAWGGIASIQVSLPAIWTAAKARGISLEQVIGWMSTRTAAFAQLPTKGAIDIGLDADLAIFAPEATFVVHADQLEHKNPITPYDGKTLSGVVRRTLLAGADIDFDAPAGELIWRGQA
ncbi:MULTISPECIES: allantoinase AllB [unclassified Pseudactinotalea]|uniref:allantoinase AllB n=1 Tax=unclassified Pseudactinotalea TaxID=2649176 RepID=UPI00128C5ECC|nr:MULTISPECIES: allantoinase AllB [unclassified Pseudactinotalea]MPV50349.1 allantoinase AllB [Pseudactinotalea sp. HY160]QGH68946.1 allantoinase AllB [Pseudactinotalea sp. HY158]